ncbi:serpin family protein [Pleomorphovibrio marinus]|uniref:serpin family protein n=1 Tax=Pleomorphovibrio marinus TaxID=2164132 RepID=UPI000E0A94BA|nr:serpin family protein [Pleomorphovibrio marinus]
MRGKCSLLLALIWLASCDWGGGSEDINTPKLRTLQVYEREMVFSSSKFAIDLFHQLMEAEEENHFFSPYSIHQALSMTMNGNEGEVLEEFIQLLRYEGLSTAEANKAAKELTQFLKELDNKVKLNIANAIWYKQGYSIFPDFKETVRNYYRAEVADLDMLDPQSVNVINNWIANQTEGLIQEMVDEIPSNAVMYLVNAIYFKGDWKYRFDTEKTQKAPFYISPSREVEVDMMELNEAATFRYYAENNLRYIEVPYSTGQFSMGILTGTNHNLDEVIEAFTFDNLENWREQAMEANFILKMPKFKMSKKMENMKEDLIAMGLERPFFFHPDNFTLLFDNPHDELKISRVIHDAFLEVDEVGTEAAAATVVEIVERVSMPSGPTIITLDQPFVFFIQEKHSGALLFMGKMGNPELL